MASKAIAKIVLNWVNNVSLDRYRNIFWYRTTDGSDFDLQSIEDLANAWDTAFRTDLKAMHSDSYTIVTVEASGVEGTPFFQISVNEAGTITGNILPPQCSIGYRLRRTDNDTRDGWKRFSSVPEGQCDDSGRLLYIAGQWKTAVDNIQSLLSQDIVGAVNTYVPIIYRKEKPGVAEASNDVNTVSLPIYVGTQNTRKPGRGM